LILIDLSKYSALDFLTAIFDQTNHSKKIKGVASQHF